jgi:hypothetical protein
MSPSTLEAHFSSGSQQMPTCPVCQKTVSIFQWDLFGRGCAACVRINPVDFEGLLDDPCPECGSRELFSTTAPALAYVQTKNGPLPSKVAPGLFIIGCSDCGYAYFRFNREGAAALCNMPGWLGRQQLEKQNKAEVHCPSCDALLNLANPSGIRISDEQPSRVFCEKCNKEISDLL